MLKAKSLRRVYMFGFSNKKQEMVKASHALPGRDEPIIVPTAHHVLNTPLKTDWSLNQAVIYFGMGCFWGAERKFWTIDGVFTTAVGYGAGFTPNPTYEEVCSGLTGHNELVMVVYEPSIVSTEAVLKTFWESHDPTQGMRQGNDIGTQYRSGIYVTNEEQYALAKQSEARFQSALDKAGLGAITTEVLHAKNFYYAERYHQQYLAKNPNGYCGLGGTGVSCQIGLNV